MERKELINSIQNFYIKDRLIKVDKDFLEFEEDLADLNDLNLILEYLNKNKKASHNKHNSILLFITGLSDTFDFQKERCDHRGGSEPDIDIDYPRLQKDLVIDLVTKKWGREQVANIITHTTFKPKGILERWTKLWLPYPKDTLDPKEKKANSEHYALCDEIKKMIPPALFGKEPTLDEIVNGNEKKNYKPHPELATDRKYAKFYEFASYIENMIQTFSFHPAGLIISNEPIHNHIPIWKNKESEAITQYDMNECSELGFIKFDFLTIVNLDIISLTLDLIKKNHNEEIVLSQNLDGDKKTYDVMATGKLSGVFQFETSGTANELITSIKPTSIQELSDINAMNRPGPLAANFHLKYIENKENGKPPDDMPKQIAKILEPSYWTLLYQEQVMQICSELAGFSLRESDDIRRAMGCPSQISA